MKKRIRAGRGLALLLAVLLLMPTLLSLRPVANAASLTVTTYDGTLTVNGTASDVPTLTIEGRTFVPMYTFVSAFTEAKYTYNRYTSYATLTAPSLTVSAGNGGTFITANDRCLYGVAANRMINGTLWVPLSVIAKACGVTVTGTMAVRGSYRALTHATRFYNQNDLYWLSRIISAESKGEPLRGQMAVGNVVLNRVRSKGYPATVEAVIFQKNQFTPAMNGTVYDAPAWLSVCVAKMCLEGYSISNDILFFCNPRTSTSSWVVKNRPFAFTIQNHSFYL